MDEQAAHGPSIIAPPPLLYLIPLLGGALLDRAVPLPGLPAGARRLGYPLAAAGVALSTWFVRTMHGANTPVDPRRAPTSLVTDGPFRHSRNPGYIGLTLAYTGISLTTNRRWPLVFLPAVIAAVDRGVIRPEERHLRDRFGHEYEDYERRVPRWL
jgi:protein-S-isoprenylcysteine O-methyltransferase Ste14